MTPAEQRAIEKNVNKVALTIKNLTRVFSEYDAGLAEVNKAFAHLAQTLNAVQIQCQAAAHARGAGGLDSFSLDAPQVEVVAAPALQVTLPVVAPAPTPALAAPIAPVAPAEPPKPKWVKPEGRLAGSKEPVYATAPKTNDAEAKALSAVSDKTGQIENAGFIDI